MANTLLCRAKNLEKKGVYLFFKRVVKTSCYKSRQKSLTSNSYVIKYDSCVKRFPSTYHVCPELCELVTLKDLFHLKPDLNIKKLNLSKFSVLVAIIIFQRKLDL